MEYKAEPEYEKCVAISTHASIREMMLPGAIALIAPVLVGFVFGPEVLGGMLAGITVSGVLMGIFRPTPEGLGQCEKIVRERPCRDKRQDREKKVPDAHKAAVYRRYRKATHSRIHQDLR